MKKILFVIATLIFTISNPITSHARQSSPPASSLYNINEKIELENGNTVDYELTTFPSDTRSNIKTATKTATCKRNNKTVATIKLSATFTYTGSSATCTSASSTYSMEGGWSYSNRTTTRTKNTASTSAKISKNNEYFNAGVTITCSNSGVIS